MHALTLWYDAHLERCLVLVPFKQPIVCVMLTMDLSQTECSYLTFHSNIEDINIFEKAANQSQWPYPNMVGQCRSSG